MLQGANFTVGKVAGGDQPEIYYLISAILAIWISARAYYSCKLSFVPATAMAGSLALVNLFLEVIASIYWGRPSSYSGEEFRIALVGYFISLVVFAVILICIAIVALTLFDAFKRVFDSSRREK